MPKLSPDRVPSYRHHKQSGQAIVTLSGRDFLLGPYGSKASRLEYDRLTGEWVANGRQLRPAGPGEITVTTLVARFWAHAQTYYRDPDGGPSRELLNFKAALAPLRRLYGGEEHRAGDFGPLALKAVRAEMVRMGWCRNVVNRQVTRIRQVFKWGVENELVPPSVLQGLAAVAGLRAGRSEARETSPVRPVPEGHVFAIKDHVARQVWAMVELQWLTGMRSGEVVRVRTGEVDTTGPLWVYRPARHKTQHHGHAREVYLGRRGQQVLAPFLKPDLQAAAGRQAYLARQRQKMARQQLRTDLATDGRSTEMQLELDENQRANRAADAADAASQFEVDRGRRLLDHEARGAELQNLAGEKVLPHVGDYAGAQVRQAQVAAESTEEQRRFVEGELKASRNRVRHLEIQAGKRTPGAGTTPKRLSGRDLVTYYELIAEQEGEAAADAFLREQVGGQADQQDEASATQPVNPWEGLRVPVPSATDRTTTVTRPPPGYGTPVPSGVAPAAQPAAQRPAGQSPRGPMIPVPSVGANAAGYSALTAPPPGTPQVTARRPITPQVAAELFAEAGYDRERAKQLAEARGYDHAAR